MAREVGTEDAAMEPTANSRHWARSSAGWRRRVGRACEAHRGRGGPRKLDPPYGLRSARQHRLEQPPLELKIVHQPPLERRRQAQVGRVGLPRGFAGRHRPVNQRSQFDFPIGSVGSETRFEPRLHMRRFRRPRLRLNRQERNRLRGFRVRWQRLFRRRHDERLPANRHAQQSPLGRRRSGAK